MLEYITTAIKLFVSMSLVIFIVGYYLHKEPLIESVGSGLTAGILFVVMIAIVTYPYQQLLLIVIYIALGIVIFLLTTVYRYYMRNLPLKDSIREGLIMWIWTILALIFVKLFVFFTWFNCIKELEKIQTYRETADQTIQPYTSRKWNVDCECVKYRIDYSRKYYKGDDPAPAEATGVDTQIYDTTENLTVPQAT